MKCLRSIRQVTIYVSILVLVACAHSQPAEEREMLILGSALTKLSAAVESTVRYKNPPAEISDAELLLLATQHDPKLLEPFVDYTIKLLRQARHAILLVCTRDGTRALLEDAGCTAEMDKHLWKDHSARVCKFTLEVQTVCGER